MSLRGVPGTPGVVVYSFTILMRRLLSRRQKCYVRGMSFARSLLVVLCAAQAGDTAIAAYVIPTPRSDMAPVVEPVARKGTRAYRPDDAAPAIPADASQAKSPSGDDALQQCIATWDEGTHISPSKWREICVRQLKENAAE